MICQLQLKIQIEYLAVIEECYFYTLTLFVLSIAICLLPIHEWGHKMPRLGI